MFCFFTNVKQSDCNLAEKDKKQIYASSANSGYMPESVLENKIVLSKDSKDFKQLLADSVSDNFRPLRGHIKVSVVFMFAEKRKRDIDNYLKVLNDAMKNLLFEDDDQIYKLDVTKHIGRGQAKHT